MSVPNPVIIDTMEEQRAARDKAMRLAQTLTDEATLYRIEAEKLDSQATHVLDELEEGGQEAKTLGQKLGLSPID